jgi:pilus assembly protein CpaE
MEANSSAEHERGLSVAIIDPDVERANAVSAIICALRPNGATPRITRLTDVKKPQALRSEGVEVVLFALGDDKERSLQAIEALSHVGGISPIVYADHADGELLIQCMRVGVREFLQYPFEQDVIQEAFERRASRGQLMPITKKPTGRSFAFLGAKGGSGVTTTACNFAVELAQESERSTLLIDLDLPLGDVALCLGVSNEYSTIDALSQAERLDGAYLSKLVSKHESGLYVLGAPGRYVRVPQPDKSVEHLLEVAMKTYDYVVVDACARLDLLDTGFFDLVSTIFLVTQVGIGELRNSNRLITECLQNYSEKVEVVLNRYSANTFGLDDNAIEGALTRPARWRIPNDYGAVRRMQNTAEPLEASNLRRAFKKMATEASGLDTEDKNKKRKGGLLSFLKA